MPLSRTGEKKRNKPDKGGGVKIPTGLVRMQPHSCQGHAWRGVGEGEGGRGRATLTSLWGFIHLNAPPTWTLSPSV